MQKTIRVIKFLDLIGVNFTLTRHQLKIGEIENLTAAQNEKNIINIPGVYCFYEKTLGGSVYIGESIHPFQRLKEHRHKFLSENHEILVYTSPQLSKSSTLHIESGLIRMADAYFNQIRKKDKKLLNSKITDSEEEVDEYFLKNHYVGLDAEIWNEWGSLGLVDKTANEVIGSSRYELSPVMSLNSSQESIVKEITNSWEKNKLTVVEGFPGTGKSVLASVLFKRLSDKNSVCLTSATTQTIHRYRSIFKKEMSEFNNKSEICTIWEILAKNKNDFDLVIVDEGHRLVRQGGKGLASQFTPLPKGGDVLSELLKTFKSVVIFYDRNQVVHPADIDAEKIFAPLNPNRFYLTRQARMSSDANDYIERVMNFLEDGIIPTTPYSSPYQVKIYENFGNLYNDLSNLPKHFRKQAPVALLAGYAWEWKSQSDRNAYDIILDGISLRWNKPRAKDWLYSEPATSLKEVAYYTTIQGMDMSFAGVIIGKDLYWENGQLKASNKDVVSQSERPNQEIFGKTKTETYQKELLRLVVNRYKILLTRGILGTWIYIVDKQLRNEFTKIFPTQIYPR